MADSKKLVSFILSWETDKYTNNKNDRGGATKYGITLATWKKVGYDKNADGKLNEEDVKLLTRKDFDMVFKKNYWDACKADQIADQSVANILVDTAYNSGVQRAVKFIQGIVHTKEDGVMGPQTLSLINNYKQGQEVLFKRYKEVRKTYLKRIGVGKQAVNLKGWLRRVDYLQYGYYRLNA